MYVNKIKILSAFRAKKLPNEKSKEFSGTSWRGRHRWINFVLGLNRPIVFENEDQYKCKLSSVKECAHGGKVYRRNPRNVQKPRKVSWCSSQCCIGLGKVRAQAKKWKWGYLYSGKGCPVWHKHTRKERGWLQDKWPSRITSIQTTSMFLFLLSLSPKLNSKITLNHSPTTNFLEG